MTALDDLVAKAEAMSALLPRFVNTENGVRFTSRAVVASTSEPAPVLGCS
jgi:hypothetical protein